MKYFTIQELSASSTAKRLGINNSPGEIEKANLNALVDKILDPLREKYGKPIIVTSGYRCPKLNKAVGGAVKSQHITGQAADIKAVSGKPADNKKLFDLILSLDLPFDQLINEHDFSWVHVSYNKSYRKQVLCINY